VKRLTFFLFTALFAAMTAPGAFAQVKYVAVVETELDARSGATADLSAAEVALITTELRREAVKNLAQDKYSVMTSETVIAQGGAVLEECAGENCVITLGSKIGADYIVRGIISKFKMRLTLSIEMYETENGTLVASSDPVRSENAAELLEKAAVACAEMYKMFSTTRNAARKPPVTPAAPIVPVVPVTYTVTAVANPVNGGAVSRNPDQTNYAPGTSVNLIATSANGYKFIGWTGVAGSGRKNRLTLIMDGDKSVTANFYRKLELEPRPQPIAPKPDAGIAQDRAAKKRRTTLAAVGLDVIGAGFFAYGIYEDGNMKTYVDDGRYENRAEYESAKKSKTNRNIGYIVGSAFLLSGISVHIFF